MSASFYDLMKYARTGIASQSMTYYDKQKALAMCKSGFPISTITGATPLSFKSDGTPLTAYSIIGNMVQNGTPTPDSPIDVVGVGERTENLFNESAFYSSITGVTQHGTFSISGGTLTVSSGNENVAYTIPFQASDASYRLYVQPNTTYYVNFENSENSRLLMFKNGSASATKSLTQPGTINTDSDANFYTFRFGTVSTVTSPVTIWIKNIMLNTGSTAKPFEPYGYKIPVSCGGVTTPIYLGQTQTVRRVRKLVMDGMETGWTEESSGSNRFFQIPLSDTGITANGVCSHFVYKTISVSNSDTGFSITCLGTNLRIRPDGISSVSLSDFKSWLSTQYSVGTPVTVWYVLATPQTAIVNEPLMKIGDYADTLDSTGAGIMIPTVRGSNVLTVDTTVQPSSVSLTGGIK